VPLGDDGKPVVLFVRADGDDSNDGRSAATPLRQISEAARRWREAGPSYSVPWRIDVGAGDYEGGIDFAGARGVAQKDFVRIVGPDVGGHPNAPAAVVRHTSAPRFSYGLRAYDGVSVWIENLAFQGGFAHAVDVRRRCYLQWRNCHVDGAGTGQVGLGVLDHCTYYVVGGIIENLRKHGIQEHHHVFRSFDTVTSYDRQMIIRNCPIGLKAKENCNGHVDYLTIEDCGTGMQLNGMSVSNLKWLRLRRNGVGLAVVNSQVHNTRGVQFGAGDDSNKRDLVELGLSADLTGWGWQDGTFPNETNHSHRQLLTVAADYRTSVSSGEPRTTVSRFAAAIRGARYRVAGTRFRVVVRGTVSPRLRKVARVVVRVGGQDAARVELRRGTRAGSAFELDAEFVCTTDGDHQLATVRATGASRSLELTPLELDLSADQDIAIDVETGHSADRVSVALVEVWG